MLASSLKDARIPTAPQLYNNEEKNHTRTALDPSKNCHFQAYPPEYNQSLNIT